MSGTTEFKDVYEAIASVSPNRQNILYTILEKDAFGEKAFFSDEKLIWESTKGGFFSQNQEEIRKLHDSGQSTAAGKKLFCDCLGGEKRLVICGGGHVSMPVIQLGVMMEFTVTVLEDRPLYANNARRAGAHQVICDSFENGLDQIEGSKDTYFVILTRGHRYDQICLERIAKMPHAYIGMIGSRKRVAKVKEVLIENGTDPEVLNQVYTPIGLNIGAETPAEIGVAIMAEIIQVKNQKLRSCGFPTEVSRFLNNHSPERLPAILTTIVARHGSAPRSVGTKMLVLQDGTIIGTIGGGCMESAVVRRALEMIHDDDHSPILYHEDLTGQDAEDDGMVCGGVVDILMEQV